SMVRKPARSSGGASAAWLSAPCKKSRSRASRNLKSSISSSERSGVLPPSSTASSTFASHSSMSTECACCAAVKSFKSGSTVDAISSGSTSARDPLACSCARRSACEAISSVTSCSAVSSSLFSDSSCFILLLLPRSINIEWLLFFHPLSLTLHNHCIEFFETLLRLSITRLSQFAGQDLGVPDVRHLALFVFDCFAVTDANRVLLVL